MTDFANGRRIYGSDLPPAETYIDDSLILNFDTTTYTVGSPEVGTTFVAPLSGRVRLTVGGGLRDSAGVDRLFLSPQVFEGIDDTGTEILAPSVTVRGFGSCPNTTAFHYASRTSLLEGLTPGRTYYARVMYAVNAGGATPAGATDIAAREIVVVPVP